MLSERGLVRRAKAYARAADSYLDKKDEVAEGMERLTPISYYIDPKIELSTIDQVKRGILIGRKAPSIAYNCLRFELSARRFESAYNQTHPFEVPRPTSVALAAVAAEMVHRTE